MVAPGSKAVKVTKRMMANCEPVNVPPIVYYGGNATEKYASHLIYGYDFFRSPRGHSDIPRITDKYPVAIARRILAYPARPAVVVLVIQ